MSTFPYPAPSEEDRGSIVIFRDPLTRETVEAVLVNWTRATAGRGLLFWLAIPDVAPPGGGRTCSENVVFTGRKATLAYRYGLQYRPCSLGAQPKGFIPDPSLTPAYGKPDWENPEKRFGCLDYPAKLSDEDVKAYELHYFGPVWRAPR